MKQIITALLFGLHGTTLTAGEIGALALEFNHHTLPLSDGSSLNVDGLGLRYSEAITLPLQLELVLGRIGVRHDDDPAALGFQSDGYNAGLNLRLASPHWHSLQIGADAGYRYYTADQQSDLRQIDLDWHQSEARGWLALHLTPRAMLYGCAVVSYVTGSQTVNSSSPSQRDLKNSQRNGYCAGIRINLNDGGYIGFEAEQRHQQGGRLYFGRYYDL